MKRAILRPAVVAILHCSRPLIARVPAVEDNFPVQIIFHCE